MAEATQDEFPPSGPGSRRRRLVFLSVSAVIGLLSLIVFAGVLLPFAIAIILAYVLMPVVKWLEQRMPRWVAVVVLYVAIVGALAGFVAVGVPRLAAELQKLARETPRAVATVRDRWVPAVATRLEGAMAAYGARPKEDPGQGGADAAPDPAVGPSPAEALRIQTLPDGGYAVLLPPRGLRITQESESRYRVTADHGARAEGRDMAAVIREALRRLVENTQEHTFAAIKTLQGVVRTVVRSIFGLGIVLMLSAYLLVTSDRVFAFFRALVRPTRQRNFDLLLRRVDRGLSGVVRGQLVIALVNGVLSGAAFYLLDLRYWPVLTLIATVLSIIPIFGAILSSIPAVLVALQDDFTKAILVLVAIVVIHQIEANLLNPKIMGDSAKVHPVMVVFALLGGEHVFGMAGALLAVPVLSIVQTAFFHFRELALGVPAPRTLRESQLPPALDGPSADLE